MEFEELKTIQALRNWRDKQRKFSRSVGFVATMGSLHSGHLELMKEALTTMPALCISIFVNPTQFAPTEDFDKYPRNLHDDLKKIRELLDSTSPRSVVGVFLPTVQEMYPSGFSQGANPPIETFVEVPHLSYQLEGSIRPHFFRGVATVVTKLFNAVQPDKAFFGQKDIQQCLVVKQMVRDLLIPVDIAILPTSRDPSGLALSSRNAYLASDVREKASIVYRALLTAQKQFVDGEHSACELIRKIREMLASEPIILGVEYVSLNDQETFNEIDEAKPGSILSLAVKLPNKNGGVTRIIDNIIFE